MTNDYDLDELMEEMEDETEPQRKRPRYEDKDIWVSKRAVGDIGGLSEREEDILQTLTDKEVAAKAAPPLLLQSKQERVLQRRIEKDQYRRSPIGRAREIATGAWKKWKSAGQLDREENLRAKDPMKYYLYKELRQAEREGRDPTLFAQALAKERARAQITGPREQDYLASAANLRAQAALSSARLEQMQSGRAPARAAHPVAVSVAPGAVSYWDSLRLGPGQPPQPTIVQLQQRDFWSQLSGDAPTSTTSYWQSLNLGMSSPRVSHAPTTPPPSYFTQLGFGPSPSITPRPPPRLQARAYRPPRRALKKWVDWGKKKSKKRWTKKAWTNKRQTTKKWKPRKKWTKWRKY